MLCRTRFQTHHSWSTLELAFLCFLSFLSMNRIDVPMVVFKLIIELVNHPCHVAKWKLNNKSIYITKKNTTLATKEKTLNLFFLVEFKFLVFFIFLRASRFFGLFNLGLAAIYKSCNYCQLVNILVEKSSCRNYRTFFFFTAFHSTIESWIEGWAYEWMWFQMMTISMDCFWNVTDKELLEILFQCKIKILL